MTCEDTVEDNYVFCFGDIWYWTPKGSEVKPQFNKLKYIGKANTSLDPIPWLGVRGKYEILNGSRSYEDWCKKAKFLGIDVLGICEKNTLAGTLQFQETCKDNNIKSIIGATYTVFNQKKDIRYDVKVYAKNYDGWQTILSINKAVLVDNEGFISEEQLKSFKTDNIYLIADPKSLLFEDVNLEFDFFQYDSVKYRTKQTDIDYLENLKKYMLSELDPVLIQDSFYLDKEDSHIKQKLNTISGVRELTSENQYFKSFDDIFDEFDELFDPLDDSFELYLENAKKNLLKVVNNCNFEIETGIRHLPNYKMTELEKKQFKTNRDLFDYLIEEGFKQKVPKGKEKEYRERLEKEIEVIEYGGVIDYFLILWDIIKWCKNQDILVGIGRGSAGGALVSYLLDIIQLDPLEYNLLFERFLTKARVKKGLPDIDTDFEGLRRNEVKRYMEHKYGEFQVCSIGTYSSLKMRAAIKDLARIDGISIAEVNYINKVIEDSSDFTTLFHQGSQSEMLKNFIKKYSNTINNIPLLFKGIRSSSIHACATLILPEDKSVFEFCPVKKMKLNDGDDVLVTEWEGGELEKAGFLKEDILGILQLDKFANILKLIKSNRDEDVDIYHIDKEDKGVYRYFHKGWNEDIFQFGTSGLKAYCKLAKPDSIEDLSAINAIYRPGAMESNAHMDYVSIRDGDTEPEYDYMLKSITQDTLGLYLYQEQVMLASQVLANFTSEEADILRKVILTKGKKGEIEKKEEYKDKFLLGAAKNGCPRDEAIKIWEKMEKFASYGFNKSHAVAYAITGYISQYLKVHYPIEFWITAFTFVPEGRKDEKIPAYISEIHQTGDIKLKPVDINKSGNGFSGDFDNNSIYWSLNSVKQCDDKA
ncbi:MAG: DNA polymerase III subunit alpha, partial [Novosphingobium sp.]|nr:DNA polymerase III subunit alpha [Novosphingobium sp.]